jgi:hypothetical protein
MLHYVHDSLIYNSQKLERTLYFIYKMKYYSAIKKNEFMKFLEIVLLVILLPSLSRAGRQILSSEFQCSEHSLLASSLTGKVRRYLVFGPPPGRRRRPQTGPFSEAVLLWQFPEAVSFCGADSHLCRLNS